MKILDITTHTSDFRGESVRFEAGARFKLSVVWISSKIQHNLDYG